MADTLPARPHSQLDTASAPVAAPAHERSGNINNAVNLPSGRQRHLHGKLQ